MGRAEDPTAKRRKRINVGLHICKRYKNLVKYNPEFCANCPFNGLKDM